MASKQITLWSWLVKSETKEEFRCPPGLRVTNEEFAAELARQIQVNELPAQVDLYEVKWDDTNIKQTRAVVRYAGKNANTDVIRLLVGIEQMGSFAYVERKAYIRHPDLPKPPREKKDVPKVPTLDDLDTQDWWIGVSFILAIGLLILALVTQTLICGLGGMMILSLVLLTLGGRQKRLVEMEQTIAKAAQTADDALAWNCQVDEKMKAWDSSWNSWLNLVLRSAYLQKLDDESGRFASAISTTIDDVVKMLFTDRHAELRNRTQNTQTQEDIEKELERRRSEAFK